MSAGATLKEFFVKLGLDLDAASFATGTLAVKGLEKGLGFAMEAAREVIFGLPRLVREVAEASDKLDEASLKAGISAQELQQLSYAAKFSSLSMDDMVGALGHLSRSMAEARKGGGDAGAAFQKLGVKTQIDGKLRNASDVFDDIVKNMESMNLAAEERTPLVTAIFGRSGQQLIPLLMEGAEGLRKLKEEATVLDDETIKMGVDYADTMTRLEGATKGLKKVIGATALPVFKDMAESALEWWKANKKVIQAKLREWVTALTAGIVVLVRAVQGVVYVVREIARVFGDSIFPAFIEMVKNLWTNFQSLGKVAVVLGGILAVLWLNATAPLLTFLAAIVFLALIFEDIWVGLQGGNSLIKQIIEGWGEFVDKWANSFDPKDNFLVKMLKEAWLWVSNFDKQWATFVADLKNLWRQFGDWFGTMFKVVFWPFYVMIQAAKELYEAITGGGGGKTPDYLKRFQEMREGHDYSAEREAAQQQFLNFIQNPNPSGAQVGAINIYAPTGDAADIKKKVQEFFDEFDGKANRAAVGGL